MGLCMFPAGKIKICFRTTLGPLGPRRRKVRFIPDAQVWASVMSLPCPSSPHQTRFAGLWRGPRLWAVLTYAASCVPTCLVRRWLVRSPATAQLPQLFCTRRWHFNGISCKFQICRPQWAEASGITDLVFGPPEGFNQIPRRASPVTGGLGGR